MAKNYSVIHFCKIEYGRMFENKVEEAMRYNIFKNQVEDILDHNENYKLGLVSYTRGINQFTDMFPHEVNALNGFNGAFEHSNSNGYLEHVFLENIYAPSEVDWRKEGAVTEVKDQGNIVTCKQ